MTTALVIDGHPNPDSLTSAVAARYSEGHGDARVLALRDLDFDPHMRHGYRRRMPLEPDLADAKEAMRAAQTIVITSPMWWTSVPALLKGFFDRALLPQQEYRYSDSGWPQGLLRGRRGRMFLLADTPWYATPLTGTPAAAQVARHTMKFCGVSPFPVRRLLGVKDADETRRARWLDDAERIGRRDGGQDLRRSAALMPSVAASA